VIDLVLKAARQQQEVVWESGSVVVQLQLALFSVQVEKPLFEDANTEERGRRRKEGEARRMRSQKKQHDKATETEETQTSRRNR
jgi:hypothetical protein